MAQDIPRIDLAAVIKAFGEIEKKNKNIVFGFFSNPIQLQTWNIPDMLDVYGLKEKCFIPAPGNNAFYGFLTKGDLYHSTDVVVVPQQEEIINMPAIEAAYCGVPVIIPTSGPTGEIIKKNGIVPLEKTDIFVSPPFNSRLRVYDSEEIAEKILKLHSSRKKQKKYDPAYKRFSWDTVIDDWAAVISD